MKKKIPVLVLAFFGFGSSVPYVLSQAAQINLPKQQQLDKQRMLLFDIDPMAGTWDLNVAESKFNPGPALKSSTIRIETYGNGIKCILDPVDAEGNARHGEWSAKYDGKDYPSGMAPFADTIALNRIDNHTVEVVHKKGKNEILNERWVLSEDRQTLTIIQKEKNSRKTGSNNILVYEKAE